ncbi:phenylacetate--CoA ligase [Clostridium sp. OM05-9]|jgi:phenylacetate-CoA ligase|uniref:Phenylacetate-coenzyme A ligase n=1 Tax=Coprococcus hominis (ex Liu et al. 2022) TaxID=2763039 RepID=A0A8I0AQE0_9FIRM|nr:MULTISPECIES: phenylacetate--CoA ligase [Clostridia]MBC5663168.1 phenylacetate--CoA ligase [Coprococcus hominis (ex Liu et al. 2022)]RHP90521.1 phenylacetate--CoA ligase [Clostridium sp. AM54-37XD]RHP94297.1 phenylacetate--CoA ligase [Clostridium sp. AM54-14XD]RHV12103.1 phenylacetate--CoA ligase [Clostridium sp. OM05-9]
MRQKKIHYIYNDAMECMDFDERKKLQGERLRATVELEYNNVPAYRKRMDEAGVKPEDINGIEDIVKLPFTQKTDLRDNFPYGLFAADLKDIVRIQGSSGTTGKPIVSGYTENDIKVWTEMVARALTAAGGTKDDIIQVAYGYGLFTGGLGAHQGATEIGATVIPMSSGNTQRQIIMMKELGATMLCCTPSYATYLAETIHEMGIKPEELKLKSGCFGAEPWTEEMRQHLEDLLDIDALDIYGLTEIGGPGVAFECMEKHGMHINEDHVLAEIIDPVTEEPLPDDTPGELVFTTLTKTGAPMIRYRTHDICTLHHGTCACGRTTVKMSRITGRTDDMLVVRGVNVFPSQIEAVLMGVKEASAHYMLVVDRVNSQDKLTVQVELKDDVDINDADKLEKLVAYIKTQIKQTLLISAKVELLPPKSIARSEGKAKRITDNRNTGF